MNYTLHQLKIFLKVAEYGSVTKAAEALHLTQPAVSIQLRKLQDQFEIPLTEVIGRQLYITDFGKQIAEVCTRIIQEAEVMKTTVDQYKGLVTGKIRIAVVSTGKYVIPYFLRGFMDRHPRVEIMIDVSNRERVMAGLVRNESDFSLVSVLPESIPVNQISLMENHLHLIGSSRFDGLIMTIDKLNELTLIFREQGSATRNAMEHFLKQHGIKTHKQMELVSNEAVKQAVNAGLGFSIMPLIGLRNELMSGSLKIFPIEGLPITTKWNLIYNVGKKMTPATSALMKYIETHKREVYQTYFDWEIPI